MGGSQRETIKTARDLKRLKPARELLSTESPVSTSSPFRLSDGRVSVYPPTPDTYPDQPGGSERSDELRLAASVKKDSVPQGRSDVSAGDADVLQGVFAGRYGTLFLKALAPGKIPFHDSNYKKLYDALNSSLKPLRIEDAPGLLLHFNMADKTLRLNGQMLKDLTDKKFLKENPEAYNSHFSKLVHELSHAVDYVEGKLDDKSKSAVQNMLLTEVKAWVREGLSSEAHANSVLGPEMPLRGKIKIPSLLNDIKAISIETLRNPDDIKKLKNSNEFSRRLFDYTRKALGSVDAKEIYGSIIDNANFIINIVESTIEEGRLVQGKAIPPASKPSLDDLD